MLCLCVVFYQWLWWQCSSYLCRPSPRAVWGCSGAESLELRPIDWCGAHSQVRHAQLNCIHAAQCSGKALKQVIVTYKQRININTKLYNNWNIMFRFHGHVMFGYSTVMLCKRIRDCSFVFLFFSVTLIIWLVHICPGFNSHVQTH